MRILSLRLRGIGPFRDEQVIDFTQMTGAGLYLISGDTGAGKSTIIDALCFALYGALSADGSDPARLRSHFAQPTQPSEVDLVFEVSGGRQYRVIRSPRYLREKKSGSGLTESKAECTLYRVEGVEEVQVARAKGEADAELRRIIGLTREQFLQTVVLPQGQFATFLRSDTKERAKVLKSIFRTDLYDRVVAILEQRARASAGAEQAATDEMKVAFQAAGFTDDETERARLVTLIEDRLDDVLLPELEAIVATVVQAAEAAGSAMQEASARLTAADAALRQAEREQAAEGAVAAAVQAQLTARAARDEARRAVDAAADLAVTMGIALDDADEQAWRARSASASIRAGELAAVVGDEERAAAWAQVEQDAAAALAALDEQIADATRAADAIPPRLQEVRTVEAAAPTTAEHDELRARQSALQQAEELLQAVATLEERQATLAPQVASAAAAVEAATGALAEATAAWLGGMAAELAAELEDGTPCRVCGSVAHPSPARPQDDAVTKDAVDELAAAANDARESLATIRQQQATCEEDLAARRAAVTMTADAIAGLRETVTAEEQALEQRATAAASAKARIDELTEEAQRLASTRADLQQALAARAAAHEAARTEHEARVVRVAAARGAFATVAAHRDAAQALATVLDGMAAAAAAVSTADVDHATAVAQRAALPDRPGFGDVAVAEQAKAEAAARQQEASIALGEVQLRANALSGGLDRLRGLAERRQRQADENGDLRELAQLFGQGRGEDFGLQIYVLRQLFLTVVEAANLRLQSLLGGRYELSMNDEDHGDGRKTLGLGLSVIDAFTGSRRPAGSLSGGETFCASLALALGLADVVQANAGGIAIDSLFIDEGFGTLDPGTLEEIMVMLHALGQAGRQVGLISHVQEMKAAITEKVEVRRASGDTPASISVSWMQ